MATGNIDGDMCYISCESGRREGMKVEFGLEETIQGKCAHENEYFSVDIKIEGKPRLVNKIVEAIRKLGLKEY